MLEIRMEEVTEDAADRIVGAGIELMSALTDGYGSDTGLQVWDVLSTQLGEDFKHAIFLAMLSGRQSGTIQINDTSRARSTGHLVAFIKLIRQYTGWGLKEAKDFADSCINQSKHLKISQGKRVDAVRDLRNIGVNAV